MPDSPKKLAILGGGVGSMVTAFEITNDPNWKEKFESITVYQMGWRIGGKGASGRKEPYGSIEEHGLHIWLGFYNNAFDAIQRAYKEMGRPPGAPLATWQDAFKKHDFIVLAQQFKDVWYPWEFNFPENSGIPGKGNPMPTLFEYMKMTAGWVGDVLKNSDYTKQADTQANSNDHQSALHWLRDIVKSTRLDVELGALTLGEDLVNVLIAHLNRMNTNESHLPGSQHHIIATRLLTELRAWLQREFEAKVDLDLYLLRFYILMDTGVTLILGLFADGVLTHPQKLDSLDGKDLREWFAYHGAANVTVWSPLMKGLYDLVFGYEGGDTSKPNFAAGTAIRCMFRITLSYKGAIFWKMQAGMGDTIFTPFYQVLKNRGVNFKFFHKVKNLGLSADGKSIATVTLARQATVKDGKEYDPLVNVLDLPCWPAEPNYDQLVEGDELKKQQINLESFYTTWKDVEEITLKAGTDFDNVAYGISLGSVPYLASELLANANWNNMVNIIQSTRTMALQAWMNKDLKELGWNDASPVMDAYVNPLNTWADMSQLIVREDWPAADNIRNIAYFCGPMEGGIPPPDKTDEPTIAYNTAKQAGDDFLNNSINTWWPKCVDGSGKFDWDSVKGTFYRANIDPSERYVLSVKGSTQYRIRGDNTGFSNLVIAGDWTVNGLNAGCVEAATMSGIIAANFLMGKDPLAGIEGYGDM
jgi:uncharacterized protein with NAD-binding domain and iron-sulfur cluster